MASSTGFFLVGVILVSIFLANADEGMKLKPRGYPAIFAFGDSNTDTGGIAAVFYPPVSPSGNTYFNRLVGSWQGLRWAGSHRFCCFAKEAAHLGIPYLSPYLNSIASNYKHGAIFATGGAAIMRPNESWFENGVGPFSLEIQVEHYTQFINRTAFYYTDKKTSLGRLMKPKDFAKALFLIDIGQNDLAAGIKKLSFQLQREALPNIVNQYTAQVQTLYQRGARSFFYYIQTALTVTVAKVKDPEPGYMDDAGCLKSRNDIAVKFNKLLKDEICSLRTSISDAKIVLVDMYRATYELIANAKNQGFEDPFRICCGDHGMGYDIWCGNRTNVNGTEVFAGACSNPSAVISWDGVHYTEAANSSIANRIIDGSFSDPPVTIKKACYWT